MPIMDKELLFGQSIDLGSTSAAATKSVDGSSALYWPKVKSHLGSSVNQQPNNNGRLYLNMVVEDETMKASGGTAVVTCRLFAHTAASSTKSGDQLIEKAISVDASGSNYPDGKQIMSIPLPAGAIKPYLGIQFAVATKKITQGKITCWIGPPTQQG